MNPSGISLASKTRGNHERPIVLLRPIYTTYPLQTVLALTAPLYYTSESFSTVLTRLPPHIHSRESVTVTSTSSLATVMTCLLPCLCIQHVKTNVCHQQPWTLRHLEDVLVEVMQDSGGRLPELRDRATYKSKRLNPPSNGQLAWTDKDVTTAPAPASPNDDDSRGHPQSQPSLIVTTTLPLGLPPAY